MKILVADALDPSGLELLAQAGAGIRQVAPNERDRLPELIADADALVVRSATKVTAELMRAGRKLKVVGRAGIGVDNVDVAAATDLGILVVNAPTANLTSATEHSLALLLGLARQIPAADASMKRGEWDRKSFLGVELHGKTLGVVGFGRIGQRVAERAKAFEMKVLAYDPFLDPAAARRLDVEIVPLDDLLREADAVTLHTPFTEQTKNLISRERIAAMKRGALLVNCARGGLIDEDALLEALDSGQIGGAAIDVFVEEPPADWRLAKHPRVVATPHIGAQTREAQERISAETAQMLLAALEGSMPAAAVNLPFRPTGARGEPYLKLGERLGRLASLLLEAPPQRLDVELWNLDEPLRHPVAVAALKGALFPALREAVNYVNAERLAESRGLEVVRSTHSAPSDDPHRVSVRLAGGGKTVEIDGALFGESEVRVVRFGGYRLEFRPEGHLLVVENRDVPGVVGQLGTLLGQGGVNIADIHLARRASGEALAVLRLDQTPPAELLEKLRGLPEVLRASCIDLT
ncbi:MAG TPA: phosphoglycerate dehydrogenase [Thermoanaerobaculia bacterium]|nr:phosphoglycerate dehydrogenase [Thermoanaerobaculia bacterium]